MNCSSARSRIPVGNPSGQPSWFDEFFAKLIALLHDDEDEESDICAKYEQYSNLRINDSGSQVKNLQRFLNPTSTKVAVSGVGSAGMETTFYGPKTANAVESFLNVNDCN